MLGEQEEKWFWPIRLYASLDKLKPNANEPSNYNPDHILLANGRKYGLDVPVSRMATWRASWGARSQKSLTSPKIRVVSMFVFFRGFTHSSIYSERLVHRILYIHLSAN